MDWLDFVASLVRSVAWPVAACVIAWLLRRELRSLFARLQTARHRDTELSFAREVDLLSEQVVEREVAKDDGETVARQDSDEENGVTVVELMRQLEESLAFAEEKRKRTRVQTLAMTLVDYPSAAILAAWAELERSLRRKASTIASTDAEHLSIPQLVSGLARAGFIAQTDEGVIAELRRLRNEAAHGMVEPTSASAIEYAATVDRLLSRLE